MSGDAQPPAPDGPGLPSDTGANETQLPPVSGVGSGPATLACAGPVIAGYEILREIGRGGQAVVYQAIQKSTNRAVAIRVLLEGALASETARKRFDREIFLTISLNHPQILSVIDTGITADAQVYCVMDYMEGVPITRYMRERKLGAKQILELFATACDAVAYAHQRGIIHRDLKPSNMLVDGEGNLKILDLGLAKMVRGPAETALSVLGQLLGTLPYMSPEQTRGDPDEIDTRTDVYALGVMLYELLCGQYPYAVVGEMAEVLRNIRESPPLPLARSWTKEKGAALADTGRGSRKCPIDDEVETIALKALAKERERRYQSASELAQDIRRYLRGEAIEARRDSSAYVLRKTLAKHRVAVGAAIFVAILLAIVAVGMTVARIRARKAQEDTQAGEAIALSTRDLPGWSLAGRKEYAEAEPLRRDGARRRSGY